MYNITYPGFLLVNIGKHRIKTIQNIAVHSM